MAEILGVVSGGAGLASLAIQLLASSRDIKQFFESARGAPEALARLALELRLKV